MAVGRDVVPHPVPPLGLLKQAPDYLAVASRINRIDVWQAAARAVGGISAPAAVMRSSTLMDGTVWNGSDPEGYARHFSIQRKGHEMKQAQRKQPVVSVDNAPGEVIILPPVQVRRTTPTVTRWLRELTQRLLPRCWGWVCCCWPGSWRRCIAKAFPRR